MGLYALPYLKEVIMIKPVYGKTIVRLTNRELEILSNIADGKSAKQVGQTLGISEITIKSHTRNIRKKLGVENTIGAIFEAIYLGYLEIGGI